jgi:uncharacterized membrane protein
MDSDRPCEAPRHTKKVDVCRFHLNQSLRGPVALANMGSGPDLKVAKLILDKMSTHIQSLRETLVSQLAQPHSTGSAHLTGHDHGFGVEAYYAFVHFVVFSFNAIGLFIIVVTMLGIVPALVVHILPGMIAGTEKGKKLRIHHWLESRMQLARGLILGMDLFVASDVVETLLHEVDLVKLFCVIAVRSWLGYERNKELEHMTKESDEEDALDEHHKHKKDL